VAYLSPVLLAGTTVKRASLHNADIIQNLDLHYKDYVYVEKGGEIIPKIVGVNTSGRDENAEIVSFISHCPECGSALIRNEGEAAHYCPNVDNCPPQIKGKLEHFISRKAMNIDSLGEGKIEMLYDSNLVNNISDLYKLEYESLIGVEKVIKSEIEGKEKKISFREKTVENILNGIEQSKKLGFEKVLFALGIRHVGETVAKKLAKHFKNIDNIAKADKEQLVAVEDIGEKIAESIIEWFADERHKEIIEELKNSGLNFEIDEEPENTSNVLAGKSFVVSGVFESFSRNELKQMIESNGGKNVSAISSKTDYVVAGKNMGPAKLEKAQNLEIPIISEDDFLKMIAK
jgi:DNA ligase (NAD+)